MAAIQQERRSIDDLNPAEYNPRKRLQPGDEEYERLKTSIETFGYVDPIIINADGTVIGGHQRLFVLRDLGYSEADVAVVDLSKADEKALNIALNKISGEWDEEKLAEIFAELDAEGYDLSLTGFGEDEYAGIVSALTDSLQAELFGDPDEVPETPKEPVTILGDVWRIGRHRIVCGDSTHNEIAEILMGDVIADVCITSPPYGASKSSKIRTKYKRGKQVAESFYNSHDDNAAEWLHLMRGFFSVAKNFTTTQFINVQMLADNKRELLGWVCENADSFVDVIVWDKNRHPPQMHANVLNNAFEFVFAFDNENNTRTIRYGDFHGNISNVIKTGIGHNQYADIHRAVYPVEFVDELLKINSKAHIIYDPFCGTGTTLISCEKNGMQCFGVEIDPLYCDVIVKRYASVTGKNDITLVRNGKEVPAESTGIFN